MRLQLLTLVSVLTLSVSAYPRGGHRGHRHFHDDRAASAAPVASGAPAPAGSASPSPSGQAGGRNRPAQQSGTPASPSGSPAASSNPTPSGSPSSGGSGGTFQIDVTNNCPDDKQFAIYQITSSFAMNQITNPVNIPSGGSGSIAAPYNGIGMRLSGTASSGTDAQWSAQALFEFGYSTYAGQSGTAYDASVMGGDEGIAVYPSNPACPSKVCSPGNCAADQGWTNPNQVAQGSPADTVCYHGKTNFKVVYCP